MRLPQNSWLKSFDERLESPVITNPYRFAGPVPDFDEPYDSGFTQTGTAVTISGGKANYVATPQNTDHRQSKALGFTLSDSLWTAEFEVNVSAVSSTDSTCWGVTAGTGAFGTPDCIAVLAQSTTTLRFGLASVDGASTVFSGTFVSSLSLSTDYFLRVQRTSASNADLLVFDDSARTSQVGSTVSFTIPAGLVSLDTLQHQSRTTGSASTISATVDNTKIFNNV